MADPFSITGSAVGVISLGLTVLSGLLQYYGDWKDSEQDIAATYTSIEGLTKTFMLIKDTLEGQSFRREIVDRVTESSDSCSAGVQSLEKKLAKIRGATPDKPGEKLRAHARKAAYPFKKSTLIKLAEVVSDLRDNLSLAVNTLQLYACTFSFVLEGSLWRLKAPSSSSDMSGSSLRKLEDISARLAVLGQQSQSVSSDIIRDVAEVRLTQKG